MGTTAAVPQTKLYISGYHMKYIIKNRKREEKYRKREEKNRKREEKKQKKQEKTEKEKKKTEKEKKKTEKTRKNRKREEKNRKREEKTEYLILPHHTAAVPQTKLYISGYHMKYIKKK